MKELKMSMKLIGAAGQAGFGKDEVCDYIAKFFPWKRIAFAKEVKNIYCNAFNVEADFIEKWKRNPEPPPGFLKNIRKSLQFIGDGFRQIHSDVWVDLCFAKNSLPLIISDVRYINEIRRVHEAGGYVILVYRESMLNDDPNGSESQIRPILEFFNEWYADGPVCVSSGSCASDPPAGAECVDFFIRNNGTLDELYAKIDRILLPELKKRYSE